MKSLKASSVFVAALTAVSFSFFLLWGQSSENSGARASAVDNSAERQESNLIKSIQSIGGGLGIAFTERRVFISRDGGESWIESSMPLGADGVVSGLKMVDSRTIWSVVADRSDKKLRLLRSDDGGNTWNSLPIAVSASDLAEASVEEVALESDGVNGSLVMRLASSSNFQRTSVYKTSDRGLNWMHFSSQSTIVDDDSPSVFESGDSTKKSLGIPSGESIVGKAEADGVSWILTQEGICTGLKTGCYQVSRIHDVSKGRAREITPLTVRALNEQVRESAVNEGLQTASMSPGGSTRISLNRGFDKCTAATAAQMQTWWDTSPYYDANIYMSGRNRGCTQAQLTASWVNTVSRQGWGLIPTIVGYQSPCSVCTNCQKHSSDPVVAEQQGREEADISITDATALGLLQGTVLYYDMERYDDLSGTGACSTPTKAFLKGWTDRLKERGYVSGVYGSPTNAVGDWLNIPQASQPDAVWLARWDNVMSVWTYGSPSPVVPENAWGNHQRIKQWKAPHNDTWGGVTFNIDGNIADGPVAGVQPRNRDSDFDGDGKADIAVYRPETGVWYLLSSVNSTFRAATFGASTDVVTPGDFDGDGKTDLAVWRPSDGVWHMYSRSIYRTYQFGMAGDIPVPADYDGDGRTDIAVFRPSNGVWYIKNSLDSKGTSFRFELFGMNGDRPVPADFDGDGRADLAVFRPSNGIWYYMRSSLGFSGVQFGISTDITSHGDYDGDGKADPAVYRDGIWYILGSQVGFYGFQFGSGEDKPAPADFDGDGRTDAAVYRPSEGVWYVLGSTRGVFAARFGIVTDRPIASAYTSKN